MTTAAEKRHMGRVAALPCAFCGDEPVQVHHIRHGQGIAQRSPNWLTIPLCPTCHEHVFVRLRQYKTNELKLLNDTLEKLYGGME